jgi:hypothetical protein
VERLEQGAVLANAVSARRTAVTQLAAVRRARACTGFLGAALDWRVMRRYGRVWTP